jgi:hypothetical protein
MGTIGGLRRKTPYSNEYSNAARSLRTAMNVFEQQVLVRGL